MIAVGIDVSNGKSMVAALKEQGELVLRPKEYQHNEKESQEMMPYIFSC